MFRPLADYNSEEESIDSILSSINKRLKRREEKEKKKNMEITAEKEKTQTKAEKTKVNDDQKTKDVQKKKETKRRSKNISESLKPAITKDQKLICYSMLSREDRDICDNIEKYIGHCFVDKNESINWASISMVIIGKEVRSLKSLIAMALGIPIIKPNYLYACISEKKLVDCEPFSYPSFHNATQRRMISGCGIFSKFGSFYCMNDTQPKKKDLETIILAADGKLATSRKKADYIICGLETRVTLNWNSLSSTQSVLPESYILDCVTDYELKPIENYLLSDQQESELSQEY